MYYHITGTVILSGPHSADSAYIRELTRCGTPEALNLSQYGLVPEAREPLGENQKHGDPIVTATVVTFPAVNKTAEELAAELAQYRAGLSCSSAQGRLALFRADLLDSVESWIAVQPRSVQIEYESRTEWKRTWSTIIDAIDHLMWTDEQVDQLFELARTL